MSTRVLVVEDEPAMAAGLEELLRAREFEVDVEPRGDRAVARVLAGHYDLVLLDVMLPGLSGFDVLRKLRGAGNETPVIMLTARGAEVDKVLGFDLQADDYVSKPFGHMELLGRIGAVLRRAKKGTAPLAPDPVPTGPEKLEIGDIVIDFSGYVARRGDAPLEAPSKCFDILRVLATSSGRAVTRDDLIDQVWGKDEFINPGTLNNLIVKLRQIIEPDPTAPRFLKTVHGVGYRLDLVP